MNYIYFVALPIVQMIVLFRSHRKIARVDKTTVKLVEALNSYIDITHQRDIDTIFEAMADRQAKD